MAAPAPAASVSRTPPDAPVEYRMPVVRSIQIGAIPDLVLHRRCTCPNGFSALASVRLLIRRHGRHWKLGELVDKMRCARCHRRPTIILSDSAHIEHCSGPPPGWSVVLVEGEPSPAPADVSPAPRIVAFAKP